MQSFVAVVETGSFAAAGQRLGISNKLVSKRVAGLENQLGMSLLHRTTRSMSLTHEGERYLEGARRVLAELEHLESEFDSTGGLKGTVRVAAPLTYGDTAVAYAANRFVEQHPNVTIELELSDHYVDLAKGGFDIAIRIGNLSDSSLIVRKLGETSMKVVAAPTYLEKHGAPDHPFQLSDHVCIRDANNPDPNRWFFNIDGQQALVPVAGPFLANSPPACLVPTRAGLGVFMCPDVFLGDDLKTGRLIELLSGFPSRTLPIQSVQLPSAFRKSRVKVFVEFMSREIREAATE
ncbi:LysR family transcriptional regulator [Aliiroseovarius sp. F20344]|uniref:LysR family transcriptional regulator n=1 Tax=Aliiroseovarius sp. F20344 TaxID=2926414 RepID=UPI001FF6AF4E|nr:LysR family transcriptional regulator [Aliiroseovarius sp. F20344]MCK0141075.1 LysR family transcriptional regulator [Aliiroseovarius sp. F20344]